MLSFFTSQTMAQSDNTKRITDTIALEASSGDIRGLMDTLPELELLWKQDPLAYLTAVKVAAPALRATSDAGARKAALDLFANVLEKTAPTETEAAAGYFGLKDKIISAYFDLEEVRSNKARLLMVADFLGEIRSRRIPNYKNQGTNAPGLKILIAAGTMEAKELTNPEQKAAYEKAVEQNKEDMNMNLLQLALFSANGGLAFALIETAKEFPATKAENRDFYEELTKRAKLTPEERTKLQLQNPK